MMMSRFVYVVVGLATFFVIVPQVSKAGTISIYDSFVSGTTYPCCFGQGVTGSAATNRGYWLGKRKQPGLSPRLATLTSVKLT
jgi:hypothetical protein